MKLEESLEVLRRTPATLSALLAGVSDGWLDAYEGNGTFGARDVLGHLIVGEEDDWMPRVRLILEHGAARPFEPFDRFGFRRRYAGVRMAELLQRFTTLRQESLRELVALDLGEDRLASPGMHPELGPVTLGQLIATWTVHDLNHIAQTVRVMARRYADEVGPWRAYLRILPQQA